MYMNVAVLQVVPTRVHPSVRYCVGDLFAGRGVYLLVAGLVCRLSRFRPAGQEVGLSHSGPHTPQASLTHRALMPTVVLPRGHLAFPNSAAPEIIPGGL